MRNSYNILVEKPEGNRQLGIHRRRWEGNIRLDLREMGWEDVDLMHLAQERNQRWTLLNTVMNLRVP
jgi:hypothetical protein